MKIVSGDPCVKMLIIRNFRKKFFFDFVWGRCPRGPGGGGGGGGWGFPVTGALYTGHGSLFTNTGTTLTPLIMPTLRLSTTLKQCLRPKYYTKTMLGLRVSIIKVLAVF